MRSLLSRRRTLSRIVADALKIRPRGGVRRDTLDGVQVSGRLSIEWRARQIHPWTRQFPFERQAELFFEQLVNDTERAIVRLFSTLPEIQMIDVRVVAPDNTDYVMLTGTVSREDLAAARTSRSPRMRLSMLGIHAWGGDNVDSKEATA